MATKFYNVEKVAEILGVSPAEVNEMREQQKLHGYRDGANWKFKADDIDQMATERGHAAAPADDTIAPLDLPDAEAPKVDTEDVLQAEVELEQANPSTSGTILGPPPQEAMDSSTGSSLSGFEDLDLTLADSGLDMSGLDMSSVSSLTGVSELGLSSSQLDDDDLVLGATGSGSGSDLTEGGGDSGISLLDPSDSGISLEEPLTLEDSSTGQDSLALADSVLGSSLLSDSMLSDSKASTDMGMESDFSLTPMDESGEDSSSQVIALDDDEDSEDLITAPPMLDGDISDSFGAELPLAAEAPDVGDLPIELASAAPTTAPAAITDYTAAQQNGASAGAAVQEAPYTTLNIIGLVFCTIVLLLVGMMLFDLARNMWSWNQPMSVNSWLMDLILGR